MYIVVNTYNMKKERSQLNNQMLHLKETEKEEQAVFKVNRRKEITKIIAEVNEEETRR